MSFLDIVRSTGPCIAQMIQPEMDMVEAVQLFRCLNISTICWSAQVDGQGACIWGLIPPTLLSDQAYLWLYTTDLAEEHQFLLVRHSQRMIEEMLKEFPILVGHCHSEDPRAQRWLKWLGAEFDFPQGKLIPFAIRRK